MAGMGMPELPLDGWDSSCHPHCSWRSGEGNSCRRRIWEHPRAAAAHPQAAKTWEKVLLKVLFCPWFGFSALVPAQKRLGVPCRGS